MKTLKITLGAYPTTAKYLAAIKKENSVSSWAEEIIKKVPLANKKQEVEIALLSFADLGLSGIQTTQQIKDAAVAKGYGLPDAEIALALALEEKKEDDWWITLHSPIAGADGDPGVLDSDRDDDGRWVGTYWGGPDGQWRGIGAFAFPVVASTRDSGTEVSSDSLSLEARKAEIEKVLHEVSTQIGNAVKRLGEI